MEIVYAILRALAIYVLLMILVRLLGRKLLAQMTIFDFIVAITIGTIAGGYVASNTKGLWVLITPVVLAGLAFLTSYLTLKSRPLRKIIEGEPVVVIQNGKILENNLKKMHYNLDQLLAQLRTKNIFNITEVEFAVLEPTGDFSVLKKSQDLPVTPKDLNINTKYQGMASEIIMNGEVIEQNLRQNHLSFSWLYKKLQEQGVSELNDVMLAALNPDGSLYVDRRGKNELDYVQEIEDKHS